jgi:hypothetical protein
MKTFDCAEVIDIAPELAAGSLCGEDRAAALAHLARCPSCQHEVNALATVIDRLLLLSPAVEPPVGFEQRVLAALPADPSPARRSRPRRHVGQRVAVMLAAAVVLVLATGAGGLLFDIAASREPAADAAEMRTPSGDVVGEVYLHDGSPSWIAMELPGWTEQAEQYDERASYAVHVATNGGRVTTYPLALSDDATWSVALDIDLETITTVTVVDPDGDVWCRAHFR